MPPAAIVSAAGAFLMYWSRNSRRHLPARRQFAPGQKQDCYADDRAWAKNHQMAFAIVLSVTPNAMAVE